MKELILLVGPPGSGKSTYSYDLKDHTYINQDSQGKEGHFVNFLAALMDGNSVIVDRMNFSKEQRDRYLVPAKEAGYKTKIVVFHVSKDICMSRCMMRNDHPTIKNETDAARAINFFFQKYERVQDDEADEVERLGWEEPKKKAIICDLDGTLCNVDHRLHFMKQDKKDWKGFYDGIPNDVPNEWCLDILQKYKNWDTSIILCSGRPDNYKTVTKSWLANHHISYDALLMRGRNDFRRDDVVKEIIYEFEIKPYADVLFAIDDRQQVVDLWRKHGITALQCAKGDF